MSSRIFLSTLIWLILVNIIIKAIFIFGVDMQVQHRVGQSEYGLYFTLLNLCYIFQIVNDFGLNLLHNTETAKAGTIRIERFYQILRLKILLMAATFFDEHLSSSRRLPLTTGWSLSASVKTA